MLAELLAGGLSSAGDVLEDVVADGLAEGAALANDDVITDLDTVEGGGHVDGEVLVALHVTLVLVDPVEVVALDDDGAGHLHLDHLTTEDAATDGDVSGEGALLVDVAAVDRGLGGLEAQTDVLEVADASGGVQVALSDLAAVLVDSGLALVGALGLEGNIDDGLSQVLSVVLLCGHHAGRSTAMKYDGRRKEGGAVIMNG